MLRFLGQGRASTPTLSIQRNAIGNVEKPGCIHNAVYYRDISRHLAIYVETSAGKQVLSYPSLQVSGYLGRCFEVIVSRNTITWNLEWRKKFTIVQCNVKVGTRTLLLHRCVVVLQICGFGSVENDTAGTGMFTMAKTKTPDKAYHQNVSFNPGLARLMIFRSVNSYGNVSNKS